MEAVGARLGRSSTRYAPPSTVFNGPVRKWRKRWIPESPSPNHASSNHHSPISNSRNGISSDGNNGSQLLLYKWTPATHSQNDLNIAKDDASATPEEPRSRKYKYIPIAVLEEQEKEVVEKVSNEAKPSDTASNAAEPTSESDGMINKPDVNDVPMEEIQSPYDTPSARQDLNKSTLDLSLGLEADVGSPDSDAKRDQG